MSYFYLKFKVDFSGHNTLTFYFLLRVDKITFKCYVQGIMINITQENIPVEQNSGKRG